MTDVLTAARAEALFISDLSTGNRPDREGVRAAVRHAIDVYGGTRACAAEVAAAYGDQPEAAVRRMRWALSVVRTTYARPRT